MATLEILSVTQPAEQVAELEHCELDAVVPREWDQFAIPISGRVGIAPGARVSRMEIFCNGKLVQTAQLMRAGRDDPLSRFESLVGVIGLPPTFNLRVFAVLQNSRWAEIGSVAARHDPVRPGYEPRMQPLMVTSLHETGSALLMRTLGAHEAVLVQDPYPHDFWSARYWMHTFRVLAQPPDLLRSSNAYTFDKDNLRAGSNPFYVPRIASIPEFRSLLGRVHVESLAAFFQERVDEWYAAVARRQGSTRPRFFAEKHQRAPDLLQPLFWELYPGARELFLVRDFRDMAASLIALSEKRGVRIYSWPRDKSAPDYVRDELRASALNFTRAWQERRGRAHLVRYEDLITDPEPTLTGMLDYLGVYAFRSTIERLIDAEKEQLSRLASEDAAASIGRWREESDDSLRAALEKSFVDVLPQFGYVD
jgi:hypothetical protein